MNRLEILFNRIHEALEEYLYPCCAKCHTKCTKRTCECKEATK